MLHAQSVHKEIINIAPNQEKLIYLPAYETDTITLRVSLHKTKKAKNNSLMVYENLSILKIKEDFSKVFETQFMASKNGIFKLMLKNENKKSADYELSYVVNSSKKKKPEIGYLLKKDTIYGAAVEQLIDSKVEEIQTVQNEKFYINSTSNALLKGGKNRIIVPVNPPENTKAWYYVFTASREENDIKNTLSSFDLASQLTKFIKEDSAIQSAVSNLSPPPGANICDIYLIQSDIEAELFKEKEDFTANLEGSRENFKSGIVKISNSQKSYLGIRNPDNLYGIHIAVEIIAIVEKTEKVKKMVPNPIITTNKIPYFIE
tara:strand:+ start:191949 stop:192902 length:954 start_codon:yes stop_codon:yes gene_type:complete